MKDFGEAGVQTEPTRPERSKEAKVTSVVVTLVCAFGTIGLAVLDLRTEGDPVPTVVYWVLLGFTGVFGRQSLSDLIKR